MPKPDRIQVLVPTDNTSDFRVRLESMGTGIDAFGVATGQLAAVASGMFGR